MTAVGQGGGKGDQGVALATESDLEGFCLIYLGHEIAAAGLGEHPQGGAFEGGHYLDAGIIPRRALGIGKADAACIPDMGIGGADDGALEGHGLNG